MWLNVPNLLWDVSKPPVDLGTKVRCLMMTDANNNCHFERSEESIKKKIVIDKNR